ncbi:MULTISPECIES: alpha/beta fold hydrolase [Protofrankia]|uniref:alpha/beta fold hydrolase n=1 Tax=Protofrankia TaxID=2994361 RepID=UPI00068216E0|nr:MULTISPECIES: alpha/beta hydrolase [Protofrankia]
METTVRAADGATLWCDVTGRGPRIVLCNGGPGLADYLHPMARLFTGVLQTVRWEQRGCGRSAPVGPFTVAQCVDDLRRVIVSTGDGPVFLLGHSWGATLALRFAVAYPEMVRSLAYISGTGTGRAWKAQWRANMRARLRPAELRRYDQLVSLGRTADQDRELAILQWKTDCADPDAGELHATAMATPWSPVNELCNRALGTEVDGWVEQDLLAEYRRLRVPVLVVHGDRDPRPSSAADSLCRALPDVHRVDLRDAGHLPWLEHPDLFRDLIRDHADHPTRFSRRPRPPRLPETGWINQPIPQPTGSRPTVLRDLTASELGQDFRVEFDALIE